MNGQKVTFDIVNGNLVITLLPEGLEAIAEALEAGINIDAFDYMVDLFEHQTCNGWSWIKPEQVGALTDSPILSNDVSFNGDGDVTAIGRVFWFPNYQVESPIETLHKTGKVTFEGRA